MTQGKCDGQNVETVLLNMPVCVFGGGVGGIVVVQIYL